MESIDKCTALKLSTCVHPITPQKLKKKYPRVINTCKKKFAAHITENNNLVIQSHMNTLEKGKELRRNTTSKNSTDRKEVYEDNINHLIIRHTDFKKVYNSHFNKTINSLMHKNKTNHISKSVN